ncbi:MAG: hypothetical protein HGA98_04435, partial [Deltaproteobacteria bacterium]|nr:hypothetical protein [Deltaproteobacteria bacterium]
MSLTQAAPGPDPTLAAQKDAYVRTLRGTAEELEEKIRELGALRQMGELFRTS